MKCENCKIEHNGQYGSGRFCSPKCARGYSTSLNKKETNAKISLALTKNKKHICLFCKNEFSGRKKMYCSSQCMRADPDLKKSRNEKLSEVLRLKFQDNLEARQRMRDIGRRGGFGTRCETRTGIKCDSLFERKAFEILENSGIIFIPHQHLPTSSKVSDAYIPANNIWLEFDGINREKRYKDKLSKPRKCWDDKIAEYKRLGLEVKIFTSHSEIESFCKNIGA